MMLQLTRLLEEYQALTGQEGLHIDELSALVKCLYIKSKYLEVTDKTTLRSLTLQRVKQEIVWCENTEKYESIDVMKCMYNLIESS
ncbi:hypothetical protein [Enterovibrio calviensis]|uniref:hypothetical protein n=1 Tax=Enterovibrio calviensis TaxID=91359 RepID=UPI00048719C9|nr:hypothetical protein [Enterovibrio calviensis]